MIGIFTKVKCNLAKKEVIDHVIRVLLGMTVLSTSALATTQYTGKIDEIEVWANGNVDFSVTPSITDCGQGRFVINKSMPGAQSLIAAVYMAKAQDKPIRIYSYGCVVADNYGSTANWIGTDYIYIKQ